MEKQELVKLKEKHGKIFTVTFLDEDEKEKTVYLRKMDRKAYKVIAAFMDKDEMLGTEALLNNLWVAGDLKDSIIEDFEALRNFGITVLPMITAKAGDLKKN